MRTRLLCFGPDCMLTLLNEQSGYQKQGLSPQPSKSRPQNVHLVFTLNVNFLEVDVSVSTLSS